MGFEGDSVRGSRGDISCVGNVEGNSSGCKDGINASSSVDCSGANGLNVCTPFFN